MRKGGGSSGDVGRVGIGGEEVEGVYRCVWDYMVRVRSVETVRDLAPDFRRLKEVKARGVAVTARDSSGDYDFVSRFFAPAEGIDEDPVTGSAHCYLGPYWGAELAKEDMSAYQMSARGGKVRVQLLGQRVRLGGTAVTVLKGEVY